MKKPISHSKKPRDYSHVIQGERQIADKCYYFRSKWEMNYAAYLQFLKECKQIKDWEYEPDTFWFNKWIKRGTVSYLPDFKLYNNDGTVEYHEVKGYMDKRSRTKINRLQKYYPDVVLHVIGKKQYNKIKKWKGVVKGWG